VKNGQNLGYGLLAIVVSLIVNHFISRPIAPPTKLSFTDIIIVSIPALLPLNVVVFFLFYYPSAQGADTIFIVTSYLIGVSIYSIFLAKSKQ
jgi:hypothetical protein